MNLAGILSPKAWIPYFLLTSFLPFPANDQITQKKNAVGQTSFSMEFPFEQPVPLSEAAKKAIATDRGIADVMKDDQLSIESIPKDWFTASEVHLGPKSETDLVVMGIGISLGPYSAGFWILRQTPQGYEIVLAVDTHDLALLDTSTNGLRDIEAGLPTGGQRYSNIYRFDGHRYQESPPAQENQPSKNSTAQQCEVDHDRPAKRIFADSDGKNGWSEYRTVMDVPELQLGFGQLARFWPGPDGRTLIKLEEPGEDFNAYTDYCFSKTGHLLSLRFQLRTAWGWGFREEGPVVNGTLRPRWSEFFNTKDELRITRPEEADDVPDALKPHLYSRTSRLPFAKLLSR